MPRTTAEIRKVPDHDTLADADWTQIPKGSYTITPLKETGETGYFVRKFALNDEVNGNKWAVTAASIEKHMETFHGQPAVMVPNDMTHPAPEIQEAYRVGEIVGTRVLNGGKLAEDTLQLDEHVAQLIYSGTIRYTSVQVGFDDGDFEMVNGGTPFEYMLLHDWVGRHDALVAEPAYGRDKAVIKHICKGSESECKRRLPASAAYKGYDRDRHTRSMPEFVQSVERVVSSSYKSCTADRIVAEAAADSAIAKLRDRKDHTLTAAQIIAIAIAPDVALDITAPVLRSVSNHMAALDRR